MGADTFFVRVPGAFSLNQAFDKAVGNARYEHGHGGYTGTIAEKINVVEITPPPGVEARAYARALVEGERADDMPKYKFGADSAAIDNKWGPAGAIKIPDGWIFFGWASS